MKALTLSRMAAARLRANKKAYVSLLIGIFLSVFLVTTLVLCIQGVILAQMERNNKRLGYEDAFLLDTPELTDGDLTEMGYFDTIGHVYVSAGIQDTNIYLGWYDETGADLLGRQVLEGRLPEKAGEIAMERSAMLAIREGLSRGYRAFTLYGALDGERLDMTVANYQALMFLAREGARGVLVGRRFLAAVVRNGSLEFPAGVDGTISVFCLGKDARGVTIRGLSYPLENAALTADFPLGVSNRFTGEPAEVTVKEGTLLILWER